MSLIFVRSSASVNSVGVWNDAATVWPGSTWRSSTMPLMGDWMTALRMSVSMAARLACDCATCAAVLASSACGALDGGLLRVELLARRHAAAAQLADVLQLGEFRLRLGQRRLRLQTLGLGRLQPGARLRRLRLELLGVDPREHLPDANRAVVVDGDGFDDAGDLGADVHLRERLELAGRRDRHR